MPLHERLHVPFSPALKVVQSADATDVAQHFHHNDHVRMSEINAVTLITRDTGGDQRDEGIARERGMGANARLDAVLRQSKSRTVHAQLRGKAARSARGAACWIESVSAWHRTRTGVTRCTKRLHASPVVSVC